MTKHNMSKSLALFTSFLVGSGSLAFVTPGIAQSVKQNSDVSALVITAPEENQALPLTKPQQTGRAGKLNSRAQPVQTGNSPVPQIDTFDPTGFRLGTFRGDISIEQSIGHSNNVSQEANGNSGTFSQTDLLLGLTSDWSRHQLRGSIDATYRAPFDDEEINQPSILADIALRLDLVDGLTLTSRGYYSLEKQGFSSSTLADGAANNPDQASYGGSVELKRDNSRLQFTLRGSMQRYTYEDAELASGIVQSQEDQNFNQYGILARVGYETSPAITPFIEGAYRMRSFDLVEDRNDNMRDSDIIELRGGLEFDMGEKLYGEFAIGYISEDYDDPQLETLSGLSIKSALNWSPVQHSLVSLVIDTQLNSSIEANQNGSRLYDINLGYAREITERFDINAFVSAQIETNDENNQTLGLGFGTQYWINRQLALTSHLEYNQFTSDNEDDNYDEFSGRLGVKWQR